MSSLFDHLSFDLPMPSLSAASASGHVDEVDDAGDLAVVEDRVAGMTALHHLQDFAQVGVHVEDVHP